LTGAVNFQSASELSIGTSTTTINTQSSRPVESYRGASSISLTDGIDFHAAVVPSFRESVTPNVDLDEDDGLGFDLFRPERASALVSAQALEAPAPVPEPSGMVLMATALSAFGLVRRWS